MIKEKSRKPRLKQPYCKIPSGSLSGIKMNGELANQYEDVGEIKEGGREGEREVEGHESSRKN